MEKKELIGLSRAQMEILLASWGERPYRATQLFNSLYRQRQWDLGRITTFPAKLRERLEAEYQASVPHVERKFLSLDRTARYLLRLADGQEIETVWMPEEDRDTICVSTQAGCAVDCKFCLTGVLGLQRNLSPGEIVGQVLLMIRENILRRGLRPEPAAAPENARFHRGRSSGLEPPRNVVQANGSDGPRRLNLVFMGMGEPLLNYANFTEAVKLLADPGGMNLSLHHMTASTSGIVPGIERLGREAVRPKLAVSLNATTDEVRSEIMPVNRKWPIAELLRTCREFPLRPRERLTFEYVLLDGVNDTAADASRLAELVRGISCKVNLIGLNPGSEVPFRTPPDERILRFQQSLIRRGLPAYIRKPRGRDIFAACGQLKLAGAETESLRTGSD